MRPVTGDGFGAYGLRIDGLNGARHWMQPQPENAPTLGLRVRLGEADDHPSGVDFDSADLRLLGGGRLYATRGASFVDYVLWSIPPDEDLLHPYLAPAAALVWRWAGREAIHAGAFAGRDGAVLVLGGKQAGKSTTLAWLWDAGITVMADDLAVVEGDQVLAGPRSIDLRPASTLVPIPERSVRSGDRIRVTLPPAPGRLPLAGVAVLEWGTPIAVTAVPVEERWSLIAAQRSFPGLAADAQSLLELVSVPTLRFTRPLGLASLAGTGRAIADAFA